MSDLPALLHPFAKPSAPRDHFVTVVRGDGALVWDADGHEYVDGMASLWFANVGYGRAEVADAVAAQVGRCRLPCFDPFTNGPPTPSLNGLPPSPRWTTHGSSSRAPARRPSTPP